MNAIASLAGLGWTRRDVPDLSGRVVAVVTGFNSGIGFEVARMLLEHGAEVIGVGRSEERCEQAVADMQEEYPGAKISYKVCDLEDLSAVYTLAEELVSSSKPISLVVNNAGRFLDESFRLTKQGFEQTLAVDYYAPALLTLLLLDTLIQNGPGRVVNVCSGAELFGSLDWADPRGAALNTSGVKAYGRAKLQLLMFSFELQRRLRLARTRVECFATQPGLVSTALFNKGSFRFPFMIFTYMAQLLMGQTPLQGAQSTIYAATAPELTGKGGSYLGPNYQTNLFHTMRGSPVNPKARDVDAWRKLWDVTRDELAKATGRVVPTLPEMGTSL